jgi:hypothetical protein
LEEVSNTAEPEPVGDGRLSRDSVQLARALNELADSDVKSQVAKLIKAIAKSEHG